ncbi:hypothetical protein DM02DRAFT_623933 [Periconia macrospinosa]|uniref:Uncharacterized protein n=1 Tax=Periconia macrospinosa TaxID=97972 RepID=A0A2V1E4M8_9PLEO|nr:hypothetical protein DM02DRAFT_623933 [Periconia macrospinosa]
MQENNFPDLVGFLSEFSLSLQPSPSPISRIIPDEHGFYRRKPHGTILGESPSPETSEDVTEAVDDESDIEFLSKKSPQTELPEWSIFCDEADTRAWESRLRAENKNRLHLIIFRYLHCDETAFSRYILPGIEPDSPLWKGIRRNCTQKSYRILRESIMNKAVIEKAFATIRSPDLQKIGTVEERSVFYLKNFTEKEVCGMLLEFKKTIDLKKLLSDKAWSNHIRFLWVSLLDNLYILEYHTNNKEKIEDADRKTIYNEMRISVVDPTWPVAKYTIHDIPTKEQFPGIFSP